MEEKEVKNHKNGKGVGVRNKYISRSAVFDCNDGNFVGECVI